MTRVLQPRTPIDGPPSLMPWTITGKTVVVTGATSGIGLEASAVLAGQGARVILVGRDPHRTEAAVAAVRSRTGEVCRSYLCDFSSQKSIRQLAATIGRDHPRLDVLVNNAGGVSARRMVTVDGLERTFATNHLGYFLLTSLLLDLIVSSAPARIVTVASEAHRQGTIDFDDLGLEEGYGIMRAYARSKLGNVLFAAELARRLSASGVTSNSLHPGTVATNIWNGSPLWARPFITLVRPFFTRVGAGAATIVQLAASEKIDGITGQYFKDFRPVTPSPLAQDVALARRLWEVSEALVRRAG